MSAKRQTQTVTLTLSTDVNDDYPEYASPLEALREELEGLDYVDEANFTIEVVDAGEVVTTGSHTDAQRARLLELKGWLYGEHLKKQAGLPSEWDQAMWGRDTACGTTCCIAGKVVLEAGGVFINKITMPNGTTRYDEALMPDGSEVSIGAKARELLKLSEQQSGMLFAGANSYEQAVAIIDAIIDGVDGHKIYEVEA